MRTALRYIIAITIVWLLGLAILSVSARHELIDAVLPPRVLAATTAEERQQITDRLTSSRRPSELAWLPPIAILLLASYAALQAKRNDQRDSTAAVGHPTA